VIVLHDFYGCRDTWAFAREFFDVDRFTFAFTELRGYGASRNLAGEYTPREAAADVLRLADNLGWHHFHLIGHSISGMLAQRVVLDGDGRVRSAVLNTPVAASGLAFSPEGFELIRGSIDSDELLGQAFAALTGNRLGAGWERYKIRQQRASRNREANLAYLRNCTEQGFLDQIRGNRTPMLIIVGEHDMEPFSAATATATFLDWYPCAELTVCGNAGHYPQQEAPVYVAALINAFLERQLAPR
jgi:pimeloyl-ACP methyl ester carboxylesterase